jgi:hypothetical protein
MRVSTGCWLAIAVASVAGCLQQAESFPLYMPPPPGDDGGAGGSSSSGGPADAGASDACAVVVTTCSPLGDAGPDDTCTPAGTVTGTATSQTSGCTAELLSLGGPAGDAGCCSSACVPDCKP